MNSPPADGLPAPATTAVQLSPSVTVSIGGVPAVVSYALAPGFAGLYQINATVGGNVPSASAVPVVVSASGSTSNQVTISVE